MSKLSLYERRDMRKVACDNLVSVYRTVAWSHKDRPVERAKLLHEADEKHSKEMKRLEVA